eukprot:gene478-605_t
MDKKYLESLTKDELINLVLDQQQQQQKTLSTTTSTSSSSSSSNQDKNKKKRKLINNNNIDFSKCYKRYIALRVAYIGWHYHGFASQSSTEETIEGYLFKALQKTCLVSDIKQANYSKSGRTDKGVSAFGQVISLYVRSNLTDAPGIIPPENINSNSSNNNNDKKNNNNNNKKKEEFPYVKMLNGVLPPYIRVLGWSPIPFHFSARFSTLYRTYKYFFSPKDLDLHLMIEASKDYIGEHNFIHFCKVDLENVKSFERVILSFSIEQTQHSQLCVATIRGYAFLWHQIRYMMSVLFLIGQKKYPKTIIKDLLDTTKTSSKPPHEMASEIPLVLYDCGYEDLEFSIDQEEFELMNEDEQYNELERLEQEFINGGPTSKCGRCSGGFFCDESKGHCTMKCGMAWCTEGTYCSKDTFHIKYCAPVGT